MRTFPILDALPHPPPLAPEARSAIAEHVTTAPDGRVAGVLVGGRDDGGIRIEAAVPAPGVETHGTEPVLPPDIWNEAYARGDAWGRIVGWYHTHPPSGPVLSEYDRTLHRILFPDHASVALVIDPETGQGRWYGWTLPTTASRSEAGAADWSAPFVVPGRGAASPGNLSQSESHFERRPRLAAAALLAVGLVAAGAAGYGIASWTGHGAGSPASSDRLQVQLRQAEQAERQLRSALDRTQGDLAAMQQEINALHQRLSAADKRLRSKRHAARIVMYRVQPGDTLSRLAMAFYGDSSQWGGILEANRSVIRNPNVLPVGVQLRIPIR